MTAICAQIFLTGSSALEAHALPASPRQVIVSPSNIRVSVMFGGLPSLINRLLLKTTLSAFARTPPIKGRRPADTKVLPL